MSKIQINFHDLWDFATQLEKAKHKCDQALHHVQYDLSSLFANIPGVPTQRIHQIEEEFVRSIKQYQQKLNQIQKLVVLTETRMSEDERNLVLKACSIGAPNSINTSGSNARGSLNALMFRETGSRTFSYDSKKSSLTWYQTLGNVLIGIAEGFVKAVFDIFKGLWELGKAIITDPLGFFKGIGNAILYPVDTFKYLYGAVEQAWERDVTNGDARSRAKFFTYSLVSLVGLKGIDKVGKVGKLGKLGKGAVKVTESGSKSILPYNVFRTEKLKEQVTNGVEAAFRYGKDHTHKFLKSDLFQKTVKQGLAALVNAKVLNTVKNVVNPKSFMSLFSDTYNAVIKSPISRTRVAIGELGRKVSKVEIPTRVRVEQLAAATGGKVLSVSTEKMQVYDLIQKFSVKKVVEIKLAKDTSKGTVDDSKGYSEYSKNLNDVEIPSVRNNEFNKWFDSLSPIEFEEMWNNPELRSKIEDRIRRPGGYHEWHLVARTPIFKQWGISMDDIKEMRSLTKDVEFVNPPGRHGRRGSTKAHNEILKIIDSSSDYESFVKRLNEWAKNRMKNGIIDLPKGLRR
ncbi:hypothetical protein [Neobacillus niacini]|uniref:hypothetical protein n=1 Tax=Neobacillus niacini TaxID=86668 RepID=UPI002865637E|nr:hypothetical protein [Neobacillus niacini]MDR6999668.1 hypothetical protein [Neobacillus niacini]